MLYYYSKICYADIDPQEAMLVTKVGKHLANQHTACPLTNYDRCKLNIPYPKCMKPECFEFLLFLKILKHFRKAMRDLVDAK